ncbi:Concanavalin A-like lectin/glucanase [Coniochaeta hoffmannii]|uniref:Concanavalin A-like lectin/glucanase n=1 Tax=Coniochaeta hoffmannii TaxID=91930 RepID=A0AA38VV71_9PEZI|nr:Concanavalin A-like lectin/glucanase [Coniochaeta hoffmannii]
MSRPTIIPPLVLLLSANLPFTTAAPSLTDDSKCACYLTNGTASNFFTHHKFFDFRNLHQYQGMPDPLDDPDASAAASLTSDFFATADWNSSWTVQNWNNSGGARSDASVLRVNSPNNVYIEKNGDPSPSSETYLTLRTQRMGDFQTAAELESNSTGYHFLSVRMLARTTGSAGAVTALFTYRKADPSSSSAGGEDRVQEADLEVITRDPRDLVHYTNQPSVSATSGDVVPDATRNVTLPGGLEWSDWAVHRLDWTPSQSTWYVDGVQTANISFQVPRDPAQLILNSWSDGGQWTGNMSVGDAAFLQIQWLDMVYNSTDEGGVTKQKKKGLLLKGRADAGVGEGCKAVCSVDETSKTGTPVILWTSGAGSVPSPGQINAGPGSRLAGWMPLGMILGMVYMSF